MRDAGCHAQHDFFANTPKQVRPSSVCKPMPQCPLMATSGLKRHLGLTSAWGQEADIAVLAIDPHFQGYGNHWFSVQLTPGQ